MSKFIPYLADEAIECDAATLLAEYAQARRIVIKPPIPIEDIVEKHLKLSIDLDDTHKLFGVPRSGLGLVPDILGAIFFDDARIVIDESLDPEEYPAKEGRYRFTLAHEGGGHWRLHRHLFAKDAAQAALFGGSVPPSVVCRSSQAKERREWQADFYASCLLMPKKLVFDQWEKRFGHVRPVSLPSLKAKEMQIISAEIVVRGGLVMERTVMDDALLEHVARPLAKMFVVSPIAMRIRLEKLGLLLREVPHQRILAGGL